MVFRAQSGKGSHAPKLCCGPECFGRGSFGAYFYVFYFEVLTMLVRGWLGVAPSLLESVLFLFGVLLVDVCRLDPWPACCLFASARVVSRLRSWLCRWLPGPPGVGSGFVFFDCLWVPCLWCFRRFRRGLVFAPFSRHFSCCGVTARWRDLWNAVLDFCRL